MELWHIRFVSADLQQLGSNKTKLHTRALKHSLAPSLASAPKKTCDCIKLRYFPSSALDEVGTRRGGWHGDMIDEISRNHS